MEVGSGLVDAVSALLAGTGIVLFARLMGLATGYRGILWRRPKGYVPENPVRQAVLSFLSPDHGILALGRLLGYVIEAQGLLVVLIGFWELAHWAMG